MSELSDRNELARQLADLRDLQMDFVKEAAEAQERMLEQVAALELDRGKSVDEVAEEFYEAKDLPVRIWADRIWHAGYLDGLREAEQMVQDKRIEARERGFRD